MHKVYQIWERWLSDAYSIDAEVKECQCGVECDGVKSCYTNVAIKNGKTVGTFKVGLNYGWLDI